MNIFSKLYIKLDSNLDVVKTSLNIDDLDKYLSVLMLYKDKLLSLENRTNTQIISSVGSIVDCNMIFNINKIKNQYIITIHNDYKVGYEKLRNAFLSIASSYFDYDINSNTLLALNYNDNRLLENIPFDDLVDREKNIFKVHEFDLDSFVVNLAKLIHNESNEVVHFRSALFNDDNYHWYAMEKIVSGQKDGFVHTIIRNIDSLAEDREKLIERGYYDPLTGVYNKAKITEIIKTMLIEAKDECYFVGILDIDYFKSINDEYGHLFGDEVIKAVTRAVSKCLSPKGRLGRIGGDELLFIDQASNCEEEGIKPLLRDIKLALQNVYINEKESFSISATIGIVASPKHGSDLEILYQKADKALYRGKTKGRDCHIIYDYDKHGMLMQNGEISYINNPSKKVALKLSNSQFINKCLDKLLASINIEKDFEEVIKDTCEFYLIDRGSLADKNGNIVASYVSSKYQKLDKFYECAYEEDYKKLFKSDNMMFFNEVYNKLSEDKYTKTLASLGVKAIIQSILLTNDVFEGYISFEDLTSKRVWQRDELLYINIICKILSGFYHKYLYEKSLIDSLYNDPLTGYYNLAEFKRKAIQMNVLHKSKTIILLDVKKFNLINEKYGFKVGDNVLKYIANTINNSLKDNEIFCRMIDDRFIILFDTIDETEVINRYNELKNKIEMLNDGYIANITLYSGAYIITDEDDISLGIDRANQARKNAKSTDSDELVFYDSEAKRIEVENKIFEEKMQESLDNEEFLVYVQPCYYIETRKICSMEALVRWNYEGNILSPGKFIPLFERNGFISNLDFYVYEQVCKTLRKWMDLGYEPITISVNVSRRHLNDHDFLEKLNGILDKYNISRELIGLELTESLFVDNEKLMISFVNNLAKAGYRIYMDDFGVAYSTLNLLSRMHVDVIKLDKIFIDNNLFNDNEKIIISHIIKMAKELGISVLSEGIETEEQLKNLTKLKCDYAQGYWFAHPQPIEDVFNKYLVKKSN